MELDNIIGQRLLVSQLKRLISLNTSGHAYAFTGPEGIGKRTIALSYIKDLLCLDKNSGNCNCTSCRTFREGTNPDFYEVITEKQSIGVDSIRELQKDAANRPTYGNRKVYLIPNAEIMTVQAQNCLLKTLEEPPEYVVIILTTNSFEALLPTIQSRTVNLRMNPYNEEEMRKIICPAHPVSNEELEFILKFSRGIPQNAIHMIEEGNINDLRNEVFKLLERPDDFSHTENIRKTLLDNRQELSTVLDILLSIYRDCLMYKQGMDNRLINSDKKDIIREIASSYANHKLFDKITFLEKTRRSFKYNINFQLGVDALLMEIQEV